MMHEALPSVREGSSLWNSLFAASDPGRGMVRSIKPSGTDDDHATYGAFRVSARPTPQRERRRLAGITRSEETHAHRPPTDRPVSGSPMTSPKTKSIFFGSGEER